MMQKITEMIWDKHQILHNEATLDYPDMAKYQATRCIVCKRRGGLWSSGHFHIPILGLVQMSYHDKCRSAKRSVGKNCQHNGVGCYGNRSVLWIFSCGFFSYWMWRLFTLVKKGKHQ